MISGRATFPEEYLTRIRAFSRRVVDLAPIMPELEEIAWRDNEEGLLLGTDKDGRPLHKLADSTLKNPRRGPGGPLIPRYRQSRVIANYRVGSIRQGPGHYLIIGAWQDVLSKPTKKRPPVPFLPFHFEGRGHLPVRDLRGLRPAGKALMTRRLHDWLAGGIA